MITSILLKDAGFLKEGLLPSRVIEHYCSSAKTIDRDGRFQLLESNEDSSIKILIAVDPKFERIDFIEYSFETNSVIRLNELETHWGIYKVSDQRERDNMVVIVFGKSNSSIKRIELITRHLVPENTEVLIESVKFIF
jgi:hypothetical protein